MSPLAGQGALRSRARAFLAGRGPTPAVALAREVLALERVGELAAWLKPQPAALAEET